MEKPETMSFATPEWVKNAIFYEIFPDRFAYSKAMPKPRNLEPWNSPPTVHGFKGGDLLGIVEHLDYLQDLGVNALYMTPIFQSTANHRYHTYDYYHIDPLLGGDAAFRILLDEAHRRGLRIILDGVFNHASRGFFQFNHILENGAASPYLDWFIVNGWPLHAYDTQHKPNYATWWGLHALPKFNINSSDVREFVLGVAQYWVEQGIDGWRLDVPEEINDDSFWREFRHRVKRANPNAYIVGEIWHDARRWLQGDQFDAVMNYLFTKACLSFFVGRDLNPALVSGVGYYPVQPATAEEFRAAIDHLLALYPPEVTQVQLNLLDSHDTARFLTLARGDESALRLAVLFMMCYPGAPCIYYGDEIGMEGGKDPDCRRAFPWDEQQWNKELLAYVKGCIALRKAHPALRRGEYRSLLAKEQVYVFGRRISCAGLPHEGLPGETLLCVLNAGKRSWELCVPVQDYFQEGEMLRELWGKGKAIVQNGCLVGLTVPAREGIVLEVVTPGLC
ncbi:MAG: glycoside hydrolase family 13 protein [Anaerolineae bacterium]